MKTATEAPLLEVLASWQPDTAVATLREWVSPQIGAAAQSTGPTVCMGNLSPAALEHEAAIDSLAQHVRSARIRALAVASMTAVADVSMSTWAHPPPANERSPIGFLS